MGHPRLEDRAAGADADAMRLAAQARDADAAFAAWLGSPIITVSVSRRHGQWYALSRELAIAGTGKTPHDACRDVTGLVQAYLRSCFIEGMSYRAALGRRAPRHRPRSPVVLFRAARTLIASALPAWRTRTIVLPAGLHDIDVAP
jgi:hypothetical protein